MAAGLVLVTVSVVGAGQAGVGAGTLALVTDLVSDAERGEVLGTGLVRPAGGLEDLAEAGWQQWSGY